MTSQPDQSEAVFLMRIHHVVGWGQTMQLVGDVLRGVPPPTGTRVLLARAWREPFSAPVSASVAQPDGRLSLRIDHVDIQDVDGAYAVSTDPEVLAEVLPPAPRPDEPTPQDDYSDYTGPPLRYTWGHINADAEGELVIQLAQAPSPEQASALERAIRAWDHAGMTRGFGVAQFGDDRGHLHGLKSDPQRGARWTGATLRWVEDFGTAELQVAADDLARRLASWTRQWGLPITHLQIGG